MLLKTIKIMVLCGLALPLALKAEYLPECKSEQDKINGCVQKRYYDNKKLKSELSFKNGKPEGVGRVYHENGNLEYEAPVKNGKVEGVMKVYYKNGNLKAEVPSKEDKREGVTKMYDENGKLFAEVSFKNDKIEGVTQYYTSSGKALANFVIKNGEVIHGKCNNGKEFTDAHLYRASNGKLTIEDMVQYCGVMP